MNEKLRARIIELSTLGLGYRTIAYLLRGQTNEASVKAVIAEELAKRKTGHTLVGKRAALKADIGGSNPPAPSKKREKSAGNTKPISKRKLPKGRARRDRKGS